jgi:hypothetical protein
MGACGSKSARYEDGLSQKLVKAGVSTRVLFAIDMTKSNADENKVSLHTLSAELKAPLSDANFSVMNPYQKVLFASRSLESVGRDASSRLAIFGHGREVGDDYCKEVANLAGASGVDAVNDVYSEAVRAHLLSGGTNFMPVLKWAEAAATSSPKAHHTLVIIGDGMISDEEAVKAELARLNGASPISVVFVGVGTGCNAVKAMSDDAWADMRSLEKLPNYHGAYLSELSTLEEIGEEMFALVQDQHDAFKRAGLLK